MKPLVVYPDLGRVLLPLSSLWIHLYLHIKKLKKCIKFMFVSFTNAKILGKCQTDNVKIFLDMTADIHIHIR